MRFVVALLASLPFAANAQAPQASDFGWRAPIEVPQGASLMRVELPASALLRLQSPQANDVRVFNGSGEAVPFAWVAGPAPNSAPEEKTQPYAALPLYSMPAGTRKAQGSVQVHVGGSQPVWVRVDGAPASAPEARPLDSVLFDTRALKKPLAAIDIDAAIPPNTPVRIDVSASRDLAQWTSVPVRGRIYRFEGQNAPDNRRLVFDQPVSLENQYLRINWSGQAIAVNSVTGVVAPPGAQPRRVRASLPAPIESATDAVEITTNFSTPIMAIAVSTPRDNTLLPVRVTGRNNNSQPWVILGQTVVYRLGTGADAMANPPLELHGASVRQLRIVATNGGAIASAQLKAEVEFAPRQLVFVASGPAPFTLAAGRDNTPSVALPSATLTGMLGARKTDELPVAKLGEATETPIVMAGQGLIPGVPNRTAALWAVLLVGVAVLGGVAWTLMRQMKDSPKASGL